MNARPEPQPAPTPGRTGKAPGGHPASGRGNEDARELQNEGDQLSMPPSREEPEARVNLGARVRVSTRKRARLFAAKYDVEMQILLDAALDEYLTRRGE